MTFQSIKIWLRILGRCPDLDVAAIDSTNNSWKATQTFKTLCYIYSFSTLFKREKDLQIDLIQKLVIGLYTKNYRINTWYQWSPIWRAIYITSLQQYGKLYTFVFVTLSHDFRRLEPKQFLHNNLFQIGVCSVSFRTSTLSYCNSWLTVHAGNQLHAHKMSQFH